MSVYLEHGNVLVIGDIMLDEYLFGGANKISLTSLLVQLLVSWEQHRSQKKN